MRIMMSGGGTAGHIYPALATAAELVDGRDEVLFVGTPNGLEARLAREAGLEFRSLSARGFDRSRPWTLVTSSLLILWSTIRALSLLHEWKPDAVVGFGGYVSIPVGFAAWIMRVPLVLHEQNSVPGLANRVLGRRATAVGVTYESSAASFGGAAHVRVTGNPVRPSVLSASRARGRASLDIDEESLVLLVFGGSRGARHVNSAVVALRDRLMAIENLVVVHVAGRAEYESVVAALEAAGGDAAGRWRVLDYVDDMGSVIAAADLVLSRAGATSIAELTVLGAPVVLVPYPYATDDHQTTNAAAVVDVGAGRVVPDSELDEPHFGDVLTGLLTDGAARARMAAASRTLGRADAARRLADLVRSAACGRSGVVSHDPSQSS